MRGKKSTTLSVNEGINPATGMPYKGPTSSPGAAGATTTMGSADDIPGAGDVSDAVENNKKAVKSGLVHHLKTDIGHGGDFISNVSSALGGNGGAEVTGKEINVVDDLKKAGGDFLDGMGRGNKTFGAAKVGGYMLGTAMLADLLNPFDDD